MVKQDFIMIKGSCAGVRKRVITLRKPTNFEASTEYDLTKKNINPISGFVGYGMVKQDFIMIKGSCAGVRKRVITLRKAIVELSSTAAKEEVELRFIDTSSKMGHGRFQTKEEKKA